MCLIYQIYLYFRQDQILLAKPNLLLEKKKVKRESLVYYNKSQKHEKCLNMVSAKAHSLTYTSTFLAPVNDLQV